jgi:hypothetical protein
MGGVFFLFRGSELNNKKIKKIKYNEGLRWPPLDILHATTNQKHMGVMEGGWDRPRDHARTLVEGDGNNKPFAEGDDNDNGQYNKVALSIYFFSIYSTVCLAWPNKKFYRVQTQKIDR